MASIERIVIVGAGLAGARAAEFLRKEGFEGTVTLIGSEADRPYNRPPLSKDYLRGEEVLDHVYVHPEPFYAEQRIELRTDTTVADVDVADRSVGLATGDRLRFDRLLLATGSQPRTLSVPGADLPGVRYLRTRLDSDALRAPDQDRRGPVAVIGAGWIGTEVAASLRSLGREVALIAPDDVPLARVLGPEVGAMYRDLHAERGVRLHLGAGVARIHGSDRVEAVETTSGARIPAELVVVGIGAQPRTELASAAGVEVGDGVEVDATLESSVPGIFAAGDIAAAWHPFYERRIRVEHWATARFQGSAVAKTMLGAGAPYDRLPYFYSDQFDVSMEYRGDATGADRMVVRGDLAGRIFLTFWLLDGRVVAAMNVNVSDVAKPIDRLIRSREVIDPETLADPAIPLEELAPAAPA